MRIVQMENYRYFIVLFFGVFHFLYRCIWGVNHWKENVRDSFDFFITDMDFFNFFWFFWLFFKEGVRDFFVIPVFWIAAYFVIFYDIFFRFIAFFLII